jgi:hypothetical protein
VAESGALEEAHASEHLKQEKRGKTFLTQTNQGERACSVIPHLKNMALLGTE